MKIFVKAKPGAKHEKVEKESENVFTVSVKEPAREGQANKAILRAVAEHFRVPLSRVSMSFGHKYKNKIIEII